MVRDAWSVLHDAIRHRVRVQPAAVQRHLSQDPTRHPSLPVQPCDRAPALRLYPFS